MALHFILGVSGSGKTNQLYETIIADANAGSYEVCKLIVPEQFTLQVQKEMIEKHPDHGMLRIDVSSFLRFLDQISEEMGQKAEGILDDVGKLIVLQRIMTMHQKEWKIFSKNQRKPGFWKEMKSFLSELYQYQIKEEQFSQVSFKGKEQAALSQKWDEISKLYHYFEQFLADGYQIKEQTFDFAVQNLSNIPWIANSAFYFDGFTGFTPIQYLFLEQLLSIAKDVTVTVTIDPREYMQEEMGQYGLFASSNKMMIKLRECAKNASVLIAQEQWMDRAQIPISFQKKEELNFLEQNLFRYPKEVSAQKPEAIEIYEAEKPVSEIAFVMQKIGSLIRTGQYRYREIAIITGNMQEYQSDFVRQCRKEQIPYFLDQPYDLLGNPLLLLLHAVLELLQSDNSYEVIFSYLKCALSGYHQDQIDKLENLVLEFGIFGKKQWEKEWIGIERLEEEEELRKQIVAELKWLHKKLPNRVHTVLEITNVLRCFLEEKQVLNKIQLQQQQLEAENDFTRANLFAQIYDIVQDVLEQMVQLLGQQQLSIKAYQTIFLHTLQEANVALIPPGIDQVLIGDLERTRLSSIRVLFLVGANEGGLSLGKQHTGILSEVERAFLSGQGISFAPTKEERSDLARFYFYLHMTKPKDKIYFTYSKTDRQGKTLYPSFFLREVQLVFPALSIQEEETRELSLEEIFANGEGLWYLADWLRTGKKATNHRMAKAILQYHQAKGTTALQLLLKGKEWKPKEAVLSEKTAESLYGGKEIGSVTVLEQYASCAFSHFLQYGLRLLERKEYAITLPQMGNLYHAVLEQFFSQIRQQQQDMETLSDSVRDQIATESFLEVTKQKEYAVFDRTARNQAVRKRLERTVKQSIWALCEQIKQGRFRPAAWEQRFSGFDGMAFTNQKEVIQCSGRIDRIDAYELDGKQYWNVVDYKSSKKKWDFGAFYQGIQLQLILYLNAAIAIGKQKDPKKENLAGGFFYFTVQDPIVEQASALFQQFAYEGYFIKEEPMMQAFDRSGRILKRSQLLSKEELEFCRITAKEKMQQLGQQMKQGKIPVNPYYNKQKIPCTYCRYHAICQFDPKKQPYRYFPSYTLEELMERKNHDQLDN